MFISSDSVLSASELPLQSTTGSITINTFLLCFLNFRLHFGSSEKQDVFGPRFRRCKERTDDLCVFQRPFGGSRK